MRTYTRLILIFFALIAANSAAAQDGDDIRDDEALKMVALEALMSAPSERALPIVIRVLEGTGSDEMKEAALFILSQIDHPDASEQLLKTAQSANGELRRDAIRMIGISGGDAVDSLAEIFSSGDADVRKAVLEAYMIAGNSQGLYNIAVNAENNDDFEAAVEMLGAMGATDELSKIRERSGVSDAIITAYIISDDADAIRELALDGSDLEQQANAIEALGIVGADDAEALLTQIYRDSDSEFIKEAALDGLLIGDFDDSVLQLYRSSTSTAEKRELLQRLVMMDSDQVLDIIDETLAGDH
ncbi:MAG: HEAT repeat domain-containing protein [Gammaproteobacteria bacterium]|nr:HEAT repeat domain-containing protein [Gammaproteobacteria bacterium]MDH3417015.1 HEAT repeat domain-containing protein [Gammaproteobacteria bacterium]